MTTKAQRRKPKQLDNRSRFRGLGFKGYTCGKRLTIVVKIRNTQLHSLGERAL